MRDGYDRWAEVYDEDLNPLVMLEEPLVRSWVAAPRGLRVADVGCGTGRHALWLADAGASVDAFDASRGMMDKAREKSARHGVRFHEHALPAPWNVPAQALCTASVQSPVAAQHAPGCGQGLGAQTVPAPWNAPEHWPPITLVHAPPWSQHAPKGEQGLAEHGVALPRKSPRQFAPCVSVHAPDRSQHAPGWGQRLGVHVEPAPRYVPVHTAKGRYVHTPLDAQQPPNTHVAGAQVVPTPRKYAP